MLRDCGLRHLVTPAIFLSLARGVEAAASACGLLVSEDGQLQQQGSAIAGASSRDGGGAATSSGGGQASAVLAAGEALRLHLQRNVHVLGAAPQPEASAASAVGGEEGGMSGRAFWSALADVAFVPATLGIPGEGACGVGFDPASHLYLAFPY